MKVPERPVPRTPVKPKAEVDEVGDSHEGENTSNSSQSQPRSLPRHPRSSAHPAQPAKPAQPAHNPGTTHLEAGYDARRSLFESRRAAEGFTSPGTCALTRRNFGSVGHLPAHIPAHMPTHNIVNNIAHTLAHTPTMTHTHNHAHTPAHTHMPRTIDLHYLESKLSHRSIDELHTNAKLTTAQELIQKYRGKMASKLSTVNLNAEDLAVAMTPHVTPHVTPNVVAVKEEPPKEAGPTEKAESKVSISKTTPIMDVNDSAVAPATSPATSPAATRVTWRCYHIKDFATLPAHVLEIMTCDHEMSCTHDHSRCRVIGDKIYVWPVAGQEGEAMAKQEVKKAGVTSSDESPHSKRSNSPAVVKRGSKPRCATVKDIATGMSHVKVNNQSQNTSLQPFEQKCKQVKGHHSDSTQNGVRISLRSDKGQVSDLTVQSNQSKTQPYVGSEVESSEQTLVSRQSTGQRASHHVKKPHSTRSSNNQPHHVAQTQFKHLKQEDTSHRPTADGDSTCDSSMPPPPSGYHIRNDYSISESSEIRKVMQIAGEDVNPKNCVIVTDRKTHKASRNRSQNVVGDDPAGKPSDGNCQLHTSESPKKSKPNKRKSSISKLNQFPGKVLIIGKLNYHSGKGKPHHKLKKSSSFVRDKRNNRRLSLSKKSSIPNVIHKSKESKAVTRNVKTVNSRINEEDKMFPLSENTVNKYYKPQTLKKTKTMTKVNRKFGNSPSKRVDLSDMNNGCSLTHSNIDNHSTHTYLQDDMTSVDSTETVAPFSCWSNLNFNTNSSAAPFRDMLKFDFDPKVSESESYVVDQVLSEGSQFETQRSGSFTSGMKNDSDESETGKTVGDNMAFVDGANSELERVMVRSIHHLRNRKVSKRNPNLTPYMKTNEKGKVELDSPAATKPEQVLVLEAGKDLTNTTVDVTVDQMNPTNENDVCEAEDTYCVDTIAPEKLAQDEHPCKEKETKIVKKSSNENLKNLEQIITSQIKQQREIEAKIAEAIAGELKLIQKKNDACVTSADTKEVVASYSTETLQLVSDLPSQTEHVDQLEKSRGIKREETNDTTNKSPATQRKHEVKAKTSEEKIEQKPPRKGLKELGTKGSDLGNEHISDNISLKLKHPNRYPSPVLGSRNKTVPLKRAKSCSRSGSKSPLSSIGLECKRRPKKKKRKQRLECKASRTPSPGLKRKTSEKNNDTTNIPTPKRKKSSEKVDSDKKHEYADVMPTLYDQLLKAAHAIKSESISRMSQPPTVEEQHSTKSDSVQLSEPKAITANTKEDSDRKLVINQKKGTITTKESTAEEKRSETSSPERASAPPRRKLKRYKIVKKTKNVAAKSSAESLKEQRRPNMSPRLMSPRLMSPRLMSPAGGKSRGSNMSPRLMSPIGGRSRGSNKSPVGGTSRSVNMSTKLVSAIGGKSRCMNKSPMRGISRPSNMSPVQVSPMAGKSQTMAKPPIPPKYVCESIGDKLDSSLLAAFNVASSPQVTPRQVRIAEPSDASDVRTDDDAIEGEKENIVEDVIRTTTPKSVQFTDSVGDLSQASSVRSIAPVAGFSSSDGVAKADQIDTRAGYSSSEGAAGDDMVDAPLQEVYKNPLKIRISPERRKKRSKIVKKMYSIIEPASNSETSQLSVNKEEAEPGRSVTPRQAEDTDEDTDNTTDLSEYKLKKRPVWKKRKPSGCINVLYARVTDAFTPKPLDNPRKRYMAFKYGSPVDIRQCIEGSSVDSDLTRFGGSKLVLSDSGVPIKQHRIRSRENSRSASPYNRRTMTRKTERLKGESSEDTETNTESHKPMPETAWTGEPSVVCAGPDSGGPESLDEQEKILPVGQDLPEIPEDVDEEIQAASAHIQVSRVEEVTLKHEGEPTKQKKPLLRRHMKSTKVPPIPKAPAAKYSNTKPAMPLKSKDSDFCFSGGPTPNESSTRMKRQTKPNVFKDKSKLQDNIARVKKPSTTTARVGVIKTQSRGHQRRAAKPPKEESNINVPHWNRSPVKWDRTAIVSKRPKQSSVCSDGGCSDASIGSREVQSITERPGSSIGHVVTSFISRLSTPFRGDDN